MRIGDFDGNLDRTIIVTSTISLCDDGAEHVARVGGDVTVWEFGSQAGEEERKTQSVAACIRYIPAGANFTEA